MKVVQAKCRRWPSTALWIILILVTATLAVGAASADSNAVHELFLPALFAGDPQEPPPSEQDYTFDSDILPWEARRWTPGTLFNLKHDSGCEDSRCGFLQLDVNNDYGDVFASPLLQGPQRPYNIDIRAKLRDKQDKQQYGVIFGADYNGGPCPDPGFSSCFTHYYEFRVRYRDVSGDQYFEYRLRRVDEHDENGQPMGEDLIDWTRSDVSNPGGFIKWTVHYGSGGHIRIKANNREQANFARDLEYADDLYFGVMTRTVENGAATGLFDMFKVTVDNSQ